MRKDAARSRQAILAAARGLYRDDAEASFGEIAAAARVGQATVYRHFADRRALLAALAEEDMERLEERLASGEEIDGGSLEALLEEIVEAQLESQGLIAAMRSGEVDASQVRGLTERVADLLAPRLAAARTAGVVRAGLEVEDLLLVLAMIDGVLAAQPERAERPAAAHRALAIALDGLRLRA
jgi:AcrR family transcriptional regulator